MVHCGKLEHESGGDSAFGGRNCHLSADTFSCRDFRANRSRSASVTTRSWTGSCSVSVRATHSSPSGGDTSYAGLVWHDGLLWISYYASHEGKTSIYLAQVRFPGTASR